MTAPSRISPAQRAETAPGDAPPISAGPVIGAQWLMRILDRQIEQFAALDALSRQQSAAVTSGDTDTLLAVLAKREDVIRAIVELSERVAPVNAAWPDLASVLPDQMRVDLRHRIDAIDKAARDIAQRDDADRTALESARTAIADELVAMGRVRGAVNAYARPATTTAPRFQDRTG